MPSCEVHQAFRVTPLPPKTTQDKGQQATFKAKDCVVIYSKVMKLEWK